MNNFLKFIYSPLRLRPFRWWLLACGGGNLLSSLLLTSTLSWHVDYGLPMGIVRSLPFVAPSLIVGGFQWLIIRRYFAKPQGWLSVIALECAVSVIVGSSFLSYYPMVYPAVLGIGIGFAGWLFFRERVHHAAYWIVAAVITQVVLYQVRFAFASMDPFQLIPSESLPFQYSLVVALLRASLNFVAQGCFTGWVLAYFISTEKQMSIRAS